MCPTVCLYLPHFFLKLRNIIPVVYRSMPKPKKLWQSFDINDKKEKCGWTLGILDMIGRSSSNNDDDLQYEMVVYVKCCHTVLMVQTSGGQPVVNMWVIHSYSHYLQGLYIQPMQLALGFLNHYHPFPLNFAAQKTHGSTA